MKTILIVLAAIAVLAVAAVIAGLLLPREHRAVSRVTVPRPIDTVWAVVSDPSALFGTWSELTEAVRLDDRDGRAVWRQKIDGWDMTLIVEDLVPPSRMVTLIDPVPGAAFGGRWIYQLAPSGDGTVVTVAEEGWIANPVFRLMANMTGLHRSLDQYLKALSRKLGEETTPDHVKGP